MSLGPEIIEIGGEAPREININTPTVNFGGGIELLMNDKKKDGTKSPTSDINVSDLTSLENELNDLTKSTEVKPLSKFEATNLAFNTVETKQINTTKPSETIKLTDLPLEPPKGVSFAENINSTSNTMPNPLGSATATDATANQKTWDGYGKFNNVPIDPDNATSVKEPELSKDEMLRKKFDYLRKLEALEKKGAVLTKQYNMESPLMEMQGEYETIMNEKESKNAVQFQGKMLMAFITGIEFLNTKFDPFDFKLDGWAEQVNENIDDYDEIFGELHDKYKSKAKMAPEIKLLFQLGGSALMLHMTNTMFKSAMPGMDDIMRQNPVLAQQFTQAAVNSMGEENPGFSNFMNNVMSKDEQSGPPPPMKTQQRQAPPRRSQVQMPKDPDTNSGVNVHRPFAEVPKGPEKTQRRPRAEMSGPSDISNILDGLKTKKIDVKQDDSSTISIQELKEMHTDMGIGKSKRRNRSDKSDKSNTISLDI